MDSLSQKPQGDDDAQLYEYLRSKFDPNTEGYKQRQNQERQLADQRQQESQQMQKQANIQDMIGGILESANMATINGERVNAPGQGTRFNDRAAKMRAQAQEMGGMSRQEELTRKKDEDQALYKYLSDKKDDRYKQQMLDATRASRAEANQAKVDDKVAKEVTSLSDKLDPTREKNDAIYNLERELGFNLEDFDETTGMVNGQKIDLPGVSVPGIGRVSGYSADATSLDAKIGAILNREIKDRAGSAVSNPEMERIRVEFSSGKYNTEEQLVAAAKAYKQAVASELKRREAGYRPEALEEYKKRGGSLSDDYSSRRVDLNPKNLVQAKPSRGQAAAASAQPETKTIGGITYRRVNGGWEEVE